VPALELWSVVQSIPDPDLAILSFGKRDCSYDIDLPLPLYAWAGDDRGPIPLPASRIAQLNDQHAFLQEPPAGLRVGDLVCCGISHPCTTFDKWRVIPVVDQDYQLVDWYRTYF
jgi:D-serine dehydratase